jgi:hypothetical protein
MLYEVVQFVGAGCGQAACGFTFSISLTSLWIAPLKAKRAKHVKEFRGE